MKQVIFSLVFLFAATQARAQLTLDECQRGTQANYPLVRQYGSMEKAREYDLSNAGKGYLPQFSLSSRATYQSDITELPVEIPGVSVKTTPRNQYQVMLGLQQTIWDGGDIHNRKRLTCAASDVDMEERHVDMYALNDRTNQSFFNVLLLDEQPKQNQLFQDDLERTHKQVSNYIINGITTQDDLDVVSVKQLNTKQRHIELETSRRTYIDMFSAFVGEKTPIGTILQKPVPEDSDDMGNGINNHPELRLFDAQGEQLRVQEAMLSVRLIPRFEPFVQGAYGNPELNTLKDEFSAFYVTDVRMSWSFDSLYTLKNSRRRIDNGRRQTETGRDVFLFNTRLQATQQDAGIISMRRKIADDDGITRLRENIRRAAEAKMENRTLTATDMLREMTNEDLVRQTKALYEVQLLMNIQRPEYTLNN